jgi:hypothetical protein
VHLHFEFGLHTPPNIKPRQFLKPLSRRRFIIFTSFIPLPFSNHKHTFSHSIHQSLTPCLGFSDQPNPTSYLPLLPFLEPSPQSLVPLIRSEPSLPPPLNSSTAPPPLFPPVLHRRFSQFLLLFYYLYFVLFLNRVIFLAAAEFLFLML